MMREQREFGGVAAGFECGEIRARRRADEERGGAVGERVGGGLAGGAEDAGEDFGPGIFSGAGDARGEGDGRKKRKKRKEGGDTQMGKLALRTSASGSIPRSFLALCGL